MASEDIGIGYARLLREARAAAGLTLAQLGAKVGVEPSTVSKWESGANPPPLEKVGLLVQNLPLSTETLLREMGVPITPTEAQHLPHRLVELLLEMTPRQQQALIELIDGLPRGRGT